MVTSLSRREAVLSWLYGRSCLIPQLSTLWPLAHHCKTSHNTTPPSILLQGLHTTCDITQHKLQQWQYSKLSMPAQQLVWLFPAAAEERGEWSPFSNMLPQWDILTLIPSPSPYVFFRDNFNRSSVALYTMWPMLKVYCNVWIRAMQMWNMHEMGTGWVLSLTGHMWWGVQWACGQEWSGDRGCLQKGKRTTSGIPTWSPTVVLTWPDHA